MAGQFGHTRLLIFYVQTKNHTQVRSKMASFSVEVMVRGYHVYKDIWTAVVGKEFPYKGETGNMFDPFAVAVMRGDTTSQERSRPFAPFSVHTGLNHLPSVWFRAILG